MGAGDIYIKTPLGMQEMSSRKLKLSPRLRTMLILIDGQQPAFLLNEEAQKVGAPTDFLDQLVSMKLVEKSGSSGGAKTVGATSTSATIGADEFARFRTAKDFMNVSVVNALGIKSFFFTLKLERAGNLADLRELVDPYHDAIAKASGADEARVLTERLRGMLR